MRAGFAVCLLLAGAAVGVAEDKPVQLPAYEVAETFAAIEVQLNYSRRDDPPTLYSAEIISVAPKSTAARAGLEKGMSLLAIEGQVLRGLTKEAVEWRLRQPVLKPFFVLTVMRRGHSVSKDIRVPLQSEKKPESN